MRYHRSSTTSRYRLALALSLTALLSGIAVSTFSAEETALSIPGAKVRAGTRGVQLVQAAALVRAPQARSTYGVNGAGLTCAVIDSGARVTHTDFAGKIIARRNFTTDDGGNPNLVTDGNGHGSNAAGIVAANGTHTGIAPGAKLAILKAATNAGTVPREAMANALQWVIDNRETFKISVVNLSVGDGQNHPNNAVSPGDTFGIRSRIQQLRAVGVPVVVSAGNGFAQANSIQGMGWPAILPESISVGAVYDSNIGRDELNGGIAQDTGPNRILPYSQRLHSSLNALDRTDVFAPGANLTSTGSSGDNASSTFHGTSEAAPIVSGIILLMQQKFLESNPALPSVDQLEMWLRDGAYSILDGDDEVDNVNNTGLQFPRADALGALQQLTGAFNGPELSNPETVTRRVVRGGGNVWLFVEANDPVGVAEVTADVQLGPDMTTVPLRQLVGPAYRATFAVPEAEGLEREFRITFRSRNARGQTSFLAGTVLYQYGLKIGLSSLRRKQSLDRSILRSQHSRETQILEKQQEIERRFPPKGMSRSQLLIKHRQERNALKSRQEADRTELRLRRGKELRER